MPKRGAPEEGRTPVKRKKNNCKFKPSWTSKYVGITEDAKEGYAFCKSCNNSFGIFNSGEYDVKRHCSTGAHINNYKTYVSTPKLSSVFAGPSVLNDKVLNSEVLFSFFVAEHNLPFLVSDHFTALCKKMFPDSEIAAKFACKRTKTTHIVNESIAPVMDANVTMIGSGRVGRKNRQTTLKCVSRDGYPQMAIQQLNISTLEVVTWEGRIVKRP